MKKLYVVAAVVGVLFVWAAQADMQITLVDSSGNLSGNYYSAGNGGEFRAIGNADLNSIVNWGAYASSTQGVTQNAIDNGSWGYNSGLAVTGQRYFQTFCIEYNEEFTPGGTYSVGISSKAMYGSQPPGGDPISKATAWLYSQFAAGALDYNYSYGTSRQTSADALQQAIWWLEGEGSATRNGAGSNYISEAEVALGLTDANVQTVDANGAFGVMALNLGSPGQVQDQLVIVPEPATMLAGTLLILPFGASTLRILRKGRVSPFQAQLHVPFAIKHVPSDDRIGPPKEQ